MKKIIHFTVVLDYGVADRQKEIEALEREIKALYPDMKIDIATAINA